VTEPEMALRAQESTGFVFDPRPGVTYAVIVKG
jgi:hypothetical protein